VNVKRTQSKVTILTYLSFVADDDDDDDDEAVDGRLSSDMPKLSSPTD